MLFATTEELKVYVSFETDTAIEAIEPYIQQAEDDYILKVLGSAQLASLQAAYDASILTVGPTPLTTANSNLLTAVRKALAPLSKNLWSLESYVRSSDAGQMIATTENAGPAQKWAVYDERSALLNRGYKNLDSLYRFLETNKATYTLWAASSSFTEFKEYFVNTAQVFQKSGIFINESRWLFAQLLPGMATVEPLYIEGAITYALMADLKTKFAAGNLGVEETEFVKRLQMAISHYAWAESLANENFRSELKVMMVTRAEDLNKADAFINAWAQHREASFEKAKAMMTRAIAYLNEKASASIFPLWFANEDYYENPAEKSESTIPEYDNANSSSSYFML